MSNLPIQLRDWVGASLISEAQAEAIQTYEAARPSSNRLLHSFMALGACVLAFGVISLVASNWQSIPDGVKLGGDFLLLLFLAGGIWRQMAIDGPALAREALLISFALACLASIGLIGQIYHADGSWDQAILLWAVILLPGVTLSERRFLPFLWTFAVLVAGSYRLGVAPWLGFWGLNHDQWMSILFALPLFSGSMAQALLLLPGSAAFVHALRTLAWLFAFGLVVIVDGARLMDFSFGLPHANQSLLGLALGAAVLIGISWRSDLARPTKLVLGLLVVLYLILIPLGIVWKLHHWLTALFVLAIFALTAVYLVWQGRPRLANLLVLLLGFRFLVLFLTAFGGLVDTGIGMILSGLLILGSLRVWLWARGPLFRWLEGLAS